MYCFVGKVLMYTYVYVNYQDDATFSQPSSSELSNLGEDPWAACKAHRKTRVLVYLAIQNKTCILPAGRVEAENIVKYQNCMS